MFDTGGGSSQFSFGHDAIVDERFSVDVGAVRYTERFKLDGAVSPDVLREAMAAISADLSRLDGRPVPDALVAMGGVVTNMTAVMHRLATYDPAVVQGTVLHRAEIDRQIELYRSMDAAARRSIVGLQPKREDVILAGACIVRTVMGKLGKDSLTVSDRGLRHGVLAERFVCRRTSAGRRRHRGVNSHDAPGDRAQVRCPAAAHHAGQLGLQQLDHRLHAVGAVGGQPPHHRPGDEDGASAGGQRLHHVGATANASIDEHRHLRTHGRDDRRDGVERCGLSRRRRPPVVGHDETLCPA